MTDALADLIDLLSGLAEKLPDHAAEVINQIIEALLQAIGG
jgi:hypothetical protein